MQTAIELLQNPEACACILNAEPRTVEFRAIDADGYPVSKTVLVRDGSSDVPRLVNEMRACGNTDIVFREVRS